MAAMPISIWVATRMPVRMGGQASGSSTRQQPGGAGHPDALGRVDEGGVDPAQPDDGVTDDRQQPVQGQGDHGGRDAEADDRDQQTDQGE